jgi:very-short-patch-repair endonuclease
MARSKSDSQSRRAWGLAHRQHGIVTRRDLLRLEFTTDAIEHRIADGRLHLVTRGVYAVGWPGLTQERRWMAAVLACGDGAALSHRSAASLWGIGKERRGRIDVSVRRRCRHRRRGLRVKSRPSLPEGDITVHRRIPVTTPVRTLLDLATELAWSKVERAVNEADKLDLVDPETLRAALGAFGGEPGVRLLRAVLDKHAFRLSDSELEVLFRPLARSAGLPLPLTKQIVNGFEVDFYWPDLGLVVETDGLKYHRTGISQSRDHLRDQTHTAAGLTNLRFSHHQIKREPAHVRSILRKVAKRRAAKQRVGL